MMSRWGLSLRPWMAFLAVSLYGWNEAWPAIKPEIDSVLYVDSSSGDDSTADGTCGAPFASINAAFSAAQNGDTLLVLRGVYAPCTVPYGRVVEIVSAEGPNSTFIDGKGVQRCFSCSGNDRVTLHGFTLINGASDSGAGANGGWLVNCVISNCTATACGGGASNCDLVNCLLVSNRVETAQSGAQACGGGAYNCWLYGCTLVGNLVRSKFGYADGGGAYVSDSSYWSDYGGAYNSIFFDNAIDGIDGSLGPDYFDGSSCIAKCLIGEDPLFVDRAKGDYRLRANSPCIDAGYNDCAYSTEDLSGSSRIQGAAVDIGCYEYEQKVAFGRKTLWLSSSSQKRSFDLYADGSWSLDSDSNWVSLDTSEGAGATVATLRVERNDGGVARSAILTLRSSDGTASAVLEVRQVATPPLKGGTRYGLFVGVNEYDPSYIDKRSWLDACVPDALSLYERFVASRLLREENAVILTNALARKAAIRTQLADLATRARSGDVVIYSQSSHGWNDSDNPKCAELCVYDEGYTDEELAEDLGRFRDDVRIVVLVDTCHSGGLFKAPGDRLTLSSRFASSVLTTLQTRRSRRRTSFAANPSAFDYDECGNVAFLTAADYDQYSWETGFHGDFTTALIDGWSTGTAESDGNGRIDFRELYDYAAARAVGVRENGPEDWTEAQCFNESLLLTTMAELTDPQWPDPAIKPDDTPEIAALKIQAALRAQGVSQDKAAYVSKIDEYNELSWWIEAMGVSVIAFNSSPSAFISSALGSESLLSLKSEDLTIRSFTSSTNGWTFQLGLDVYDPKRVSATLLNLSVGVAGADSPEHVFSVDELEVSVRPSSSCIELEVAPLLRPSYFFRTFVR